MNSCSSKYLRPDQFLLFVLAFFNFKIFIVVDASMIYRSVFLDEFSVDIEVLRNV
jgi:hypothetical protein